MTQLSLGWLEWLALPNLELPAIKAKIDTGARTSSLHAFAIEPFGPSESPMVRFGVHPIENDDSIEVFCTARVVDRRHVTSSNGEPELRYIIETSVNVGDHEWPIEMSLSNRESMSHRMLLGRTALEAKNIVIDPRAEFLQEQLSYDIYGGAPSYPPIPQPLTIALLTMEPENYSSRRLIEAGREAGHIMEPINTLNCYMDINSLSSVVHYDGRPLPQFDAVIPRIGASITPYGSAVVRQFAMTGAYCLNSAESILTSRDKLLSYQLLARHRFTLPTTAFAHSPRDTRDLIEIVGGSPLVVKLMQSTQGKGVVLAETRKAAESVIDAFRGLNANFLVQEFISNANGSDIRCLVLGGRVIASMRRHAAQGDFRSNLHQGGTAEKVKISKEERKIAVRAAKLMGLSFAGVDVLRSDKGPLVLEINSSPGLQGIEAVSGKDIASEIISHIETKVEKPLVKKASVSSAA